MPRAVRVGSLIALVVLTALGAASTQAQDEPGWAKGRPKTDEAMKIFKDAWEKSITEKNADGKVYGDLIKEGKLPGKND